VFLTVYEYLKKGETLKKGGAMYKTCPDCGAHLDPGELCDCRESAAEKAKENQAA
jgi:hypothetical protein